MNRTEQFFYCTRPRLTEILIGRGHTPEIQQNIFIPEYKTWKFPINADLAESVAAFYTEWEEPVPEVIRNFLEPGKDGAFR